MLLSGVSTRDIWCLAALLQVTDHSKSEAEPSLWRGRKFMKTCSQGHYRSQPRLFPSRRDGPLRRCGAEDFVKPAPS
jgi:hypothetical protein